MFGMLVSQQDSVFGIESKQTTVCVFMVVKKHVTQSIDVF